MHATTWMAVALIGWTTAAPTDGKYTSQEGRFRITFPKGAAVQTRQETLSDGQPQTSLIVDQGEKGYIVMYSDLPESRKNVPARTLLDAGQLGAVQPSGKLLRSKDRTFGEKKLPGRELLVDRGGIKVRQWIVIDGLRIYVVMVGGSEEFVTGPEGTAYLESFELVK